MSVLFNILDFNEIRSKEHFEENTRKESTFLQNMRVKGNEGDWAVLAFKVRPCKDGKISPENTRMMNNVVLLQIDSTSSLKCHAAAICIRFH